MFTNSIKKLIESRLSDTSFKGRTALINNYVLTELQIIKENILNEVSLSDEFIKDIDLLLKIELINFYSDKYASLGENQYLILEQLLEIKILIHPQQSHYRWLLNNYFYKDIDLFDEKLNLSYTFGVYHDRSSYINYIIDDEYHDDGMLFLEEDSIDDLCFYFSDSSPSEYEEVTGYWEAVEDYETWEFAKAHKWVYPDYNSNALSKTLQEVNWATNHNYGSLNSAFLAAPASFPMAFFEDKRLNISYQKANDIRYLYENSSPLTFARVILPEIEKNLRDLLPISSRVQPNGMLGLLDEILKNLDNRTLIPKSYVKLWKYVLTRDMKGSQRGLNLRNEIIHSLRQSISPFEITLIISCYLTTQYFEEQKLI